MVAGPPTQSAFQSFECSAYRSMSILGGINPRVMLIILLAFAGIAIYGVAKMPWLVLFVFVAGGQGGCTIFGAFWRKP